VGFREGRTGGVILFGCNQGLTEEFEGGREINLKKKGGNQWAAHVVVPGGGKVTIRWN